jgi:hypothetical protein
MIFGSGIRELRRGILFMLETHIMTSSLIFCLVLILVFRLASYSRALPPTSCRALPQFAHVPNHSSYGFGSRENHFEPIRFGYDPRPHCGDCFPRRPGFPTGGSHTHFEPRHLDDPCFPHHGSRPTRSNGEVQRTVKTSSGRMVKCWIPKIYLTNPSTELSTSSHPM